MGDLAEIQTERGLNALFVKSAQTVTAISHTTIDGESGIWTVDGKLTAHGPGPASTTKPAN